MKNKLIELNKKIEMRHIAIAAVCIGSIFSPTKSNIIDTAIYQLIYSTPFFILLFSFHKSLIFKK